jgi:hypothetical protein
MTKLELFRTILITICGIVSLFAAKSAKKPQKSINLFIGIILLLAAIYDILVLVCGITIF